MAATAATLIVIVGLTIVFALMVDRLEQAAKRRDREIIRRIHTYMAQLPPARPW